MDRPENPIPISNSPQELLKSSGKSKKAILDKLKALSAAKNLPLPTTPVISVPKPPQKEQIVLKLETKPKTDEPPGKSDHPQFSMKTKAPENKREEMNNVLMVDRPLGFGLGRAIQYLNDHKMLIKHEDEVILEYRDSKGNLLDAKAAYKYHSHIFSGLKPGEASRQKQKRKLEMNKKEAALAPGESPLHVTSALREVLKEKNQPFIEITGKNKSIVPFSLDSASHESPNLSSRVKRLKLKKNPTT